MKIDIRRVVIKIVLYKVIHRMNNQIDDNPWNRTNFDLNYSPNTITTHKNNKYTCFSYMTLIIHPVF